MTTKENIEILNELSGKGYEAAKSLGEINLRIVERTLARQMDAWNMFMDSGLRNVKMVTEAKGPADLVRGQVDLFREVSERMLTESRETMKLASEAKEEYRSWFDQGLQEFNEKMNKLRPTA